MRGHTYVDKGPIQFGEVQMVFHDDEESVVSTMLNLQIMRQLNRHADIFGEENNPKWRDYMFDCKCELYNSREIVTETYILKGCIITDVEYTESDFSNDTTKSEISVTIMMNDIEYLFPEKYESLMNWTQATKQRQEAKRQK